MDTSQRPRCLQETRIEQIEAISEWVTAIDKGNMLWISGVAGAGKSTLVNTVADIYSELHRLGAYVYFSRDQALYSQPAHVVKTIAYQLAKFDSRLGAAISAIIERDSQKLDRPLLSQFDALIADAIRADISLTQEGPIVIIIDALDECGTATDRKDLVRILSERIATLPTSFRFIITSRPERDLEAAFESRKHVQHHPLDITAAKSKADVDMFVRSRILELQTQAEPGWPGEERVRMLIILAAGWFIWAATACALLEDYPTDERLDGLLKIAEPAALAKLEKLYDTALSLAGDWKPDFTRDCRAILGLIIAARIPLSCSAIDALLERQKSSAIIIRRFKSLLHWSETGPVRPLHASFPDYLTDRDRCKDKSWFFDLASEHHSLAKLCIDLLSRELKENILELTLRPTKRPANWMYVWDKLPEPLDLSLPEATAYASASWINHVCAVGNSSAKQTMGKIIDGFPRVHLLHWLEAMSILRQSRFCVGLLGELLHWIPVSPTLTLSYRY